MYTENNLTTENTTVLPKIMVGTDDFKKLLLNSDVFVDKSLLIKGLLEDSGEIILITRPRRWGKTINMDMVRRFLEIEIDPQGNPLPLEDQQIDKFAAQLQAYLLHSTSYHDLSLEKDYHNLMGGLLTPLVSSYTILSNKEAGLGRCDHILTPIAGRGDHAIIIEYKVVKDKKELDPIAKAGLAQIQDKQYEATIKQQPHVKKMSKISLAFFGKQVAIHYSIV
ncbi:MAG: ATP-binding protein [Amoebophilaceae bacterium]|nr:ATP-binding protein [Amoebophilaceae bacterium]